MSVAPKPPCRDEANTISLPSRLTLGITSSERSTLSSLTGVGALQNPEAARAAGGGASIWPAAAQEVHTRNVQEDSVQAVENSPSYPSRAERDLTQLLIQDSHAFLVATLPCWRAARKRTGVPRP